MKALGQGSNAGRENRVVLKARTGWLVSASFRYFFAAAATASQRANATTDGARSVATGDKILLFCVAQRVCLGWEPLPANAQSVHARMQQPPRRRFQRHGVGQASQWRFKAQAVKDGLVFSFYIV